MRVLGLFGGDSFRSSSSDIAGDAACGLSLRGDCLDLYFATGDASCGLSLRGDLLGCLGSFAVVGSVIWDNDNC
mgnify:FL=1